MTPVEIENLKEAVPGAVASELTTKVPASLTLAQWALESGWGQHIPEETNNAFGIKSYAGCAGTKWLLTSEGSSDKPVWCEFATFPTLQACFEKHAELITQGHPYRPAWANYLITLNPYLLAEDIAPIYSTNPEYGATIIELMKSPVIQASLSAKLI